MLPPLISSQEAAQSSIVPLIVSDLVEVFQPVFGHFEIVSSEKTFHSNIIVSVKKIADDEKIITALQHDFIQATGDSNFTLVPFGIPGGGMDILSMRLLDADLGRLLLPKDQPVKKKSFVIFCDVLSQAYPIGETIAALRVAGAEKIAIFSITEAHPAPDIDIEPKIYIPSHYITSSDIEGCGFCRQGVEVIKGEYFDDYVRKLRHFDSYTFWELISQDESFFNVGHWPSNRTPNHYQFRFLAKSIFLTHSFGLSVRLKNLVEERSILPRWVKKIVCTEGEESGLLSMALSEAIGLTRDDVIKIPRKLFSSIAGKEIDEKLIAYIDSTYGADSIKRQNVIIVDQAAHHFRTMTGLRDICEYYGCTVLAFAVFIDRTEPDFSLGEYLYDSHYITLYSWPFPPRRNFECPCVKE